MVLGGARVKTKIKASSGTQAWISSKMVLVPSASAPITSERSMQPKTIQHVSSGDSDTEFNLLLPSSHEPMAPHNILKPFKKMLHKALNQT